ncbi:MAG: type I restriction-modification system subunit M N-terminal domain-containing protein [Planctomycetota bacterium]
MNTTQDIVAKLWSLCHVLRDDGITYHEYATELTFLLFLKMMKETEQEKLLPAGYRWDDLTTKDCADQLAFYRALRVHLCNEGSGRVQTIFADVNTSLRQPKNLAKIVTDIAEAMWQAAV